MLTPGEGDGSIGNTDDCGSASTQRRGGSRVLHCEATGAWVTRKHKASGWGGEDWGVWHREHG